MDEHKKLLLQIAELEKTFYKKRLEGDELNEKLKEIERRINWEDTGK